MRLTPADGGAAAGPNTSIPRWLTAAIVSTFLVLAGAEVWYFRVQERLIVGRLEAELAAIAVSKSALVTQWRAGRFDDAGALMEYPLLRAAVIHWTERRHADDSEPIIEHLRSLERRDEYSDALLVDPGGRVLLAAKGAPGTVDVGMSAALAVAFRTGRPSISDVHGLLDRQSPHIDTVSPIVVDDSGTSRPVAAIILRSDVRVGLYPLVSAWPTPSESGEALLIVRDGDDAVALNDRRVAPASQVPRRVPMSRGAVPAVRAVLGASGALDGANERGVPVVAYVARIPHSPWFLVTQMDRAEALAPWRFRALLVALGTGAVLLGVTGLMFLARQIALKAHYLALYEAESAVARAARELERSNADLEQFAYVASHDLQEPLRMISSYLQLIERRYKGRLDSDADEFIGFAVDGAARLQRLIQDLLAYSRVQSRGRSFAEFEAGSALETALTHLATAIEESSAVVTHDPLPLIVGDETQVTQILQNLIGNAIKFRGDAPPRIHVSARALDREWVFSVADNGIGIDPAYHDRIFTIFSRLHARSAYEGTGIGLAIAKRATERHGGRIWVDSAVGRGSVFHVTVPKSGSEGAA